MWTTLLGSTDVRREVMDNVGDVSEAYAMVLVTRSLTRGAYCYYYAEPPAFLLPPEVRFGPPLVYTAMVPALIVGAADGGGRDCCRTRTEEGEQVHPAPPGQVSAGGTSNQDHEGTWIKGERREASADTGVRRPWRPDRPQAPCPTGTVSLSVRRPG